MFSLIIRIFVKNPIQIDSAYVQLGYIKVVSLFSIVINVFFSTTKIILGVFSGSIALTSDGIDSLTNVLSSFILILSYKVLVGKETLEHPFGAGRIIYIANFVIALLLALTGFEMVRLSIKSWIFTDKWPTFSPLILWVIGCSFIINEWLARFCFYVAKKIKSDLMHTEALHRRWDNFLSLMVVISWVASLYGLLWVDSLVGIFFGATILKSAYSIALENIHELLGTSPSKEMLLQISRLGKTIPGVIDIHEIVVHNYGKKVVVSAHVEMDESLKLRESHLICDQVEDLIEAELGIHTITHADPVNKNNPLSVLLSAHKDQLIIDEYLQTMIADISHIYVGKDYEDPSLPFISLDLFLKRPIDKNEEQNLHQILYLKVKSLIHKDFRLKIRPRPLFGSSLFRN